MQCEYFSCNSPLRCLNDHERAREFVALWKSGKSPGLTATQRGRFLSQLKCESVASGGGFGSFTTTLEVNATSPLSATDQFGSPVGRTRFFPPMAFILALGLDPWRRRWGRSPPAAGGWRTWRGTVDRN